MISVKDRREFLDEIQDEEYRHEFAAENPGVALAFQINLMREARGWTQEELARRCDKAQETISRLEDPNYGRYTLKTLKHLAKAFDVALLVRFVSFGELADWTVNLDSRKLTPPSYGEERQMSFYHVAGSPEWRVQSIPLSFSPVDADHSATFVAGHYVRGYTRSEVESSPWHHVADGAGTPERSKEVANAAA